jgi:hypothetical protein
MVHFVLYNLLFDFNSMIQKGFIIYNKTSRLTNLTLTVFFPLGESELAFFKKVAGYV